MLLDVDLIFHMQNVYKGVKSKAQFRRRASVVPNLIEIRFDCSTAETRL